MSYRVGEPKPKKPNRTVQNAATPATFYITNGTAMDFAIPCWYKDILPPVRARHHCKAWHDHVGQPSPNHPDHVCQPHDFAHEHIGRHHEHGHHCHHYLDMARMIPIHLLSEYEGYETVEISLEKPIEGLILTGVIDEKQDWVVRVHASANVTEAIDKPVRTHFAVKVANGSRTNVDMVMHGIIEILPAPIG